MLVLEVFPMKFINWVFLACLLCSSVSLATQEQACHPIDLLALKEFAGNLTNTSISSSWSNDSICCNWDGVVCEENLDDGTLSNRVVILNLSKKGLGGAVSQSLCRLDHLKVLNLSYNHLEGVFPSNLLMNLKQLEVLDLSYNMLTGPVSESLVGSKSVYSINISSNLFEGNLLDLGEFQNLVAFNASNNSLTGGFNSRICSSSNKIRVLDLSMNHFNGGLEGLESCSKSLQRFHVDYNFFSGHLPESLYSIASLEQVSVSGNNFSGQLSKNLSKLSSLKILILYGNHFMGPFPNVFTNLTQLEYFAAHSNSFSGPLPSTLTHCSKLRFVDLQNNSLSGTINLNFTQLPHLCTLDLGSNNFHGGLPDSLSSCQELRVLSLAKNQLSGQIPKTYANLTSLIFFSISNNTFANLTSALTTLQSCKNLRTLVLTRNFHGEEIPRNIIGFESLTTFALGNCAIKGGIPVWLLNCTKLQALDLSWNHLNGSIPHWIGQMESLFYIDFSNNSLIGEIPKSLTDLKSLTCTNCSLTNLNAPTGIPLYVKRNQSASGLQYNQASNLPPSIILSNNKINGTIWPEIGKLRQLHLLDLSKNNITGTIPSSISDMGNIEVLDLSSNNLYGSIPSSLNKLTFLSKFSVANNHLQGAIPTGGQFLSFPSSSFEGNPGLCGGMVSPCTAITNMGLRPGIPSGSKNQLGRGSIFGITISIGVGIALLFAIVVLRMSRRGVGYQVDGCLNEESSYPNPNRLSASFGSSKLVLFHNSNCKDLTVDDLLKSTNNFSQANIIGCGGFGLVYKADLPNGSKVAIKRLSGDCGQIDREFQAEVEALSRAQHKNLVSLQGYCRHGTDRLLIYSYMENGSLDYWLHETVEDNGSALKWDKRLKIAQGAARGLAYLHKEPNIVHRDIKTSNILLDERFEAHLADFGLSRLLRPYDTHVTTDLVGTLGYIPPEYSQTLTATFRGDVYSFGIVLLELITGRRPVEVCKGKNCRDLVSWIFQMKSENREVEIFDSSIWDKDYEKEFLEVFGIACKCIDQDPRRRPSIDQVVSWLNGVRAEPMESATK